jgi:DNA-binding LytR/AlgR family response regulator
VIPAEDIDYLKSDEKYTVVAWRDGGKASEALVRTPLKDLIERLDPAHFVQVHRSVVVNRSSITRVTRGVNETAQIHLKGRDDVLPVSRSFTHLFKQM